MNSAGDEAGASTRPVGGYIRLRLSYKDPLHGARTFPSLVLISKDRQRAETIRLNAGNIDKILGPFPRGNYFASIIAPAGKPDKESVPIAIVRQQTKDLAITLSPDGIIEGQITTSLKSGDRSVGMPVDWYLPEEKRSSFIRLNCGARGFTGQSTRSKAKRPLLTNTLFHAKMSVIMDTSVSSACPQAIIKSSLTPKIINPLLIDRP